MQSYNNIISSLSKCARGRRTKLTTIQTQILFIIGTLLFFFARVLPYPLQNRPKPKRNVELKQEENKRRPRKQMAWLPNFYVDYEKEEDVGFHQDNIEYSLELLSETVILFAYKDDNAKVAMRVSPAAHEVLPLEESDLVLIEEDGDRVYIAPARMRGFLGEICLPELDIDCLGDIQKQDISYGNYLFDVTLSSTLITGANDGVIFDVWLSRERMEPWV